MKFALQPNCPVLFLHRIALRSVFGHVIHLLCTVLIQEKVDIDPHAALFHIQLRTGCFRMMTLSLVATHPDYKNYKILSLNNNKISICLCALDAPKPFETKKLSGKYLMTIEIV